MPTTVEASGKTIEAAYDAALAKLGVPRASTTMEVITEPTKGLFGLFGGKDATVRVTVREDLGPLETARNFLNHIFGLMNLTVAIEAVEQEEYTLLSLTGDNLGLLIGKHGQTLDSLQYLTNLAANRGVNDDRVRFVIDIEDYRARREETLRHLAFRLAEKARRTGEKIMLEPMNCHERKIIHVALQDNYKVKTYSAGDEPHRKVIIEPKNLGRPEGGYRGRRGGYNRGGYNRGGYQRRNYGDVDTRSESRYDQQYADSRDYDSQPSDRYDAQIAADSRVDD